MSNKYKSCRINKYTGVCMRTSHDLVYKVIDKVEGGIING